MAPLYVNHQETQTISVYNSGSTTARVTKLGLTKSYADLKIVNPPKLPFTLYIGQSVDVQIKYAPTQLGTETTKLHVVWDITCPDSADLNITAPCVPNSEIHVTQPIDAGVQQCIAPLEDTTYIRNAGNGPLIIYSLSISGINMDHFRVIAPHDNDTCRAKDSIPLIIEYNRPTEGSSTASLLIMHNDAETGPLTIPLTGRRTISEYGVSGDSTTAFFTRLFMPQTRTFTITNTSNQPVIIDSLIVENLVNVFSVNPALPLPVTLQAKQTLTFDVIFNPNTKGPFKTAVAIITSPCGLNWLIDLNGSGDTNGLSPDKGDVEMTEPVRVLDALRYADVQQRWTGGGDGDEPVVHAADEYLHAERERDNAVHGRLEAGALDHHLRVADFHGELGREASDREHGSGVSGVVGVHESAA